MKRLAAIGTALMLAAACGSDSPTTPTNNTGPIVFTAQLSAANEAPPITNADANARGTATITFNVSRDPATGGVNGGGTVNFSAQVSNFPGGTPINLAHIHTGAVRHRRAPCSSTRTYPQGVRSSWTAAATELDGQQHSDQPGGRHEHRDQSRWLLLQHAQWNQPGRRRPRPARKAVSSEPSSNTETKGPAQATAPALSHF